MLTLRFYMNKYQHQQPDVGDTGRRGQWKSKHLHSMLEKSMINGEALASSCAASGVRVGVGVGVGGYRAGCEAHIVL